MLAIGNIGEKPLRDPSDTGLLVVGDPRLITKGYGRLFLDSLPGMTHP